MITVKHITTYFGPNIYSKEPVILVSVDISPEVMKGADKKISHISALCAEWFSWKQDNISPSPLEVTGFITAWAHALLCEVAGSLSVAKTFAENDKIYAVLDFHDAELSFYAISLAAKIFAEDLSVTEMESLIRELWKSCKKFHPDFQAQFLIDYSRSHNIPYRPFIHRSRHWHYGWGTGSNTFFESSPLQDSAIGKEWGRNKSTAKRIFKDLGAPIAANILINNETELERVAKTIGFPCVAKPLDKGMSIGVTVNIKNNEELKKAYIYAKDNSGERPVMIETHIAGDVHRIILSKGKLWRVFHREAPYVTGDGESSLGKLVEDFNGNIRRKQRPGSFFGPAPIDDNFKATLRNQNIGLDDIAEKGRKIKIRNIPLLSHGASYFDVTDKTHPHIAQMSEAIARTFGIELCGIDFMSEDISRSCYEQGAFIEINTTPGLRTPWISGVSNDEIAEATFGDIPFRIPLILVIADKKHHDDIYNLIPKNRSVGWICGNRSGLGDMIFPQIKDLPAYLSIDKIIKNKTISSIAMVCDINSVTQYGMPVDRSDTTVIFDSNENEIDKKWQGVLSDNTENFSQLDDLKKLSKLFAKILGK